MNVATRPPFAKQTMEHLHEYWIHYTISNVIALTVLGLTWKVPTAGRIAFGVVFLLASIVNTYTVLTTPEAYLFYKDFAVLELYRQFTDDWFATHAQAVVLPIAAGQLLIAGGMFLGGRSSKPAIAGVVIFGLAIAPLGIGSAFPCTIILAFAAILLWGKQHGRQNDVVETEDPSTCSRLPDSGK